MATTVGLLALLGGTSTAAPAPDAGSQSRGAPCTDVRIPGELPVPPVGMSAEQNVTIGEDCLPHLSAVRFVPTSAQATQATQATAKARTAAATGTRQVSSWSEMYDCCKILMTGLYTTSTWNTAGNQVTDAVTETRTANNREPWDAGWSLETSGKTEDGPRVTAHAEFSYRGIFDATGLWYANTHDTSLLLKADGTASCEFDIKLRHTFVGWNSVRGCA